MSIKQKRKLQRRVKEIQNKWGFIILILSTLFLPLSLVALEVSLSS